MRTNLRRNAIRLVAAASAFGLPLALVPPAQADPGVSAVQSQLVNSVTAPLVKNHLRALQNIANANNGTRAAGTKGHDASAEYVAAKLRKAGWRVTLQPFEFGYFTENSAATLAQISPDPKTYTPTEPGSSTLGDFSTMTYSASGDVTGTVQAVDLTLPPTPAPSSTSGCEASDFAGFTRGNVALVQRGTCDFEVKARNALAAGASAVIIFNEGQPGRTNTVLGRLAGPGVTIPVLGASFAVGEDLASPAGTVVHIKTDTTSENRLTHNVIADSRWGDPNKVVMIGAHLDSVVDGPGINDNGSGSAADLTVAEALGRIPTTNRLRFAWWSAEELGLLGSQYYVDNLPADQRSKVKLYLNFDMVASPNYALKIYDGDDSDQTGSPAGPAGSAEIEKLFEKYFDTLRQPHNGTDFDGRSDYGPFIEVGIPSGGLFTGAEGIKTAEEAALFGGVAGQPYDGCYHQACDTVANISDKALALNTGAIATAAVVYGFSRNLPGSGAPAAAAPQKKTLASVAADGRVSG